MDICLSLRRRTETRWGGRGGGAMEKGLQPFRIRPFRILAILVISYPLLFSTWSLRTQFGHFVPVFIFNWKLFWNLVFYIFIPKSFRNQLSQLVPRSFRNQFEAIYEMTWVQNVCSSLLRQTKT